MEINIRELIPIQEEVDQIVVERLGREPSAEERILAFNVELFEYFNAVGTWKWWKKNHSLNKSKILDELADCFAFFLSLVAYTNKYDLLVVEEGINIIEAFETDLNSIYLSLDQGYSDRDSIEVINNFIMLIGVDNESGKVIGTVHRFSIAILITKLLFKGITWEEIINAYKEKSRINIERQNKNY